jgi:hypothetical protein
LVSYVLWLPRYEKTRLRKRYWQTETETETGKEPTWPQTEADTDRDKERQRPRDSEIEIEIEKQIQTKRQIETKATDRQTDISSHLHLLQSFFEYYDFHSFLSTRADSRLRSKALIAVRR